MNTHRSLTSVDIVGGQDRVDVIEAYSEVVSDSLLAYDKDLIILSIFYKGVGPNHKRKKNYTLEAQRASALGPVITMKRGITVIPNTNNFKL